MVPWLSRYRRQDCPSQEPQSLRRIRARRRKISIRKRPSSHHHAHSQRCEPTYSESGQRRQHMRRERVTSDGQVRKVPVQTSKAEELRSYLGHYIDFLNLSLARGQALKLVSDRDVFEVPFETGHRELRPLTTAFELRSRAAPILEPICRRRSGRRRTTPTSTRLRMATRRPQAAKLYTRYCADFFHEGFMRAAA